jgi:hypothetical protein
MVTKHIDERKPFFVHRFFLGVDWLPSPRANRSPLGLLKNETRKGNGEQEENKKESP